MRSIWSGVCSSVDVSVVGLGDGDRDGDRDEDVGCAPITAFSLIIQPSPIIIGPS